MPFLPPNQQRQSTEGKDMEQNYVTVTMYSCASISTAELRRKSMTISVIGAAHGWLRFFGKI